MKLYKIIFVLIAIMMFCSCQHGNDVNSGAVYNDSVQSESNVIQSTPTNRELFIEKYGYDIDRYTLLEENNKLYLVLLENPIDKWAEENCENSDTTGKMLECEHTLEENWKREITTSLSNLQGLLSEDLYTKLEQNIAERCRIVTDQKTLSEGIMRDLDIYGTYSAVHINTQLNEQYRQIAFELKYCEYIFQTNPSANISIEFIP